MSAPARTLTSPSTSTALIEEINDFDRAEVEKEAEDWMAKNG